MSESVLLEALLKNPMETEWLEFKHNKGNERQIGEYISALSNAAALAGQRNGYLVWGVEDTSRKVLGTTFNPQQARVGNELPARVKVVVA
nr:putative DNA binding domain-containing protein [Rhodoferax sp.]